MRLAEGIQRNALRRQARREKRERDYQERLAAMTPMLWASRAELQGWALAKLRADIVASLGPQP